jgi:uncharacterized membrane protein YadS
VIVVIVVIVVVVIVPKRRRKRKRQPKAQAPRKNITMLGFALLFVLLCKFHIVMCIVMCKSLIYKQC